MHLEPRFSLHIVDDRHMHRITEEYVIVKQLSFANAPCTLIAVNKPSNNLVFTSNCVFEVTKNRYTPEKVLDETDIR